PPTAKHYFYVWPRDASYVCIAADIAGIRDVQENFFNWCLKRAECFNDTGLFFEKYYVNGLKASSGFQPDQNGAVLFAIWHHYRKDLKKACEFESLITKAANGLCDRWKNDHFDIVSNDIWEERFVFPDLNENFTHSLAACIKGLECANEIIPNKYWLSVAKQMRERIEKHFVDGFFVRSYGELIDKSIDASMLGIVYPFGIYDANNPMVISTVNEFEKKLVIKGGMHRYEFDEYDGWMYNELHRKKGAGAWPLLNFWMSVYYSIKGDKNNAEKYYQWVLDRTDGYIPEQIFENEIQVSVCPLVWSHAMFIISSKFLGYV
ncbi:MAG: glycoside hydrolase family 15 protein, partial [Candidatus Heimdallarchaeota archaeon]|nr:glycoside hydrolase family 15 protein [Candidatus Heimdallarchaeota archaeon]